ARLRQAISGTPSGHAEADAIAETLKAARYGVVAWSAGSLDYPQAELAIQAAVDLVKGLNLATRFAALPLAGHDGLIGANQVSLWQAGVPLRSSFADGAPLFDPVLYDGRRRLEAGESDLLLWIASFAAMPPPKRVPTIALVTPDTKFDEEPAVVIPVAT